MIDFLVIVGGIAAAWVAVMIGARRFEALRKREGAWNDDGPKDPTFADPNPALRAAGVHLPRIEPPAHATSTQRLPELRPPNEEL